MSEAVIRVLVVGGAILVATGIAVTGRIIERRRARRGPLDLSGFSERVLFFSDSACAKCEVVRSRLSTAAVDHREVRFDDDPDAHRRAGVTAVPLIVVRGSDGRERDRITGVPSAARLRRIGARAA